jgi:hypothetical protein
MHPVGVSPRNARRGEAATMAKRSRITSWAAALAVAVLTFPVAADDWQPPPENAERCQNNMARYNEITA